MKTSRKFADEIPERMTVAVLIEMLEQVDQDAVVMFSCSYGDYHNTPQALWVNDVLEVDSSAVGESRYSRSGYALLREDGVDEEGDGIEAGDDDDEQTVVILK